MAKTSSKKAVVSAANREVQRTIKQMSPELKEQFEAISTLLADTEQTMIVAWFKVSQHICEVCENPDKYGGEKRSDAIQLLATALNMGKSELYARRTAALQWTEKEIIEMSKARSPRGPAITTSMLQLLTSVSSNARRKKLAARVISEGMTVEGLRKALKMGSDGGSVSAGVSLMTNPVSSFNSMGKVLGKYNEIHERVDAIVKKMSDNPDKYANDKTITVLETVSSALETAETSAQKDRRAIDAALDALRRTAAAAASSEESGEETPRPRPLKKKKKKPVSSSTTKVRTAKKKAAADKQGKEHKAAVHAQRVKKLRKKKKVAKDSKSRVLEALG